MRNLLAGTALAVILVAGLFAAAHFGSHPGVDPAIARLPDPTAAVADLKLGFLGQRQVGAWTLACGWPRELPRQPQTGNSQGIPPKMGAPPGWKIPFCHVTQAVKIPDTDREVHVTVRRFGFKNALAIFLRFPPEDIDGGQPYTLKEDDKAISIIMRGCSARFCLGNMSVKHSDEPALLKIKTLQLSFLSKATGKSVTLSYPMFGFAQAIVAMRKLDK